MGEGEVVLLPGVNGGGPKWGGMSGAKSFDPRSLWLPEGRLRARRRLLSYQMVRVCWQRETLGHPGFPSVVQLGTNPPPTAAAP